MVKKKKKESRRDEIFAYHGLFNIRENNMWIPCAQGSHAFIVTESQVQIEATHFSLNDAPQFLLHPLYSAREL